VVGDIAMAFRLYHRMNHNVTWLSELGWPIIYQSAAYFASTAVQHAGSTNFTWNNVVTADEHAGLVNSSAFVNAIAAETLSLAVRLGYEIGQDTPTNWTSIANNIYLPVVTLDSMTIHPEFDGYHGQDVNQADVALLQYPLQRGMASTLAANDLLYYQARSSTKGTSGFFTGDSAYAIAWQALGNQSAAEASFRYAFEHVDQTGYYVWTEKSFADDHGHLNFITGAGGFLQSWLFGFAGARYIEDGVTFAPVLPPLGVMDVDIRHWNFRGAVFGLSYNATMAQVELKGLSSSTACFRAEQQEGACSAQLKNLGDVFVFACKQGLMVSSC
jgi:trehalose/maltose hydrolase-like predicted phosphorylase